MANNDTLTGLWRTIATALDVTADTSLLTAGYMRKAAEALNPGNPSGYDENEAGYLTRIAVATNAGSTAFNSTIPGLLKRIAEGLNAGNPSGYLETAAGFLTRIAANITPQTQTRTVSDGSIRTVSDGTRRTTS